MDLFTGYPVKIEIFEGPMDLLLHLVKREELDIYEVAIAQITEQYLGYVRTMQMINIGLAGEFLVMAATLMHIKSRHLLPPGAGEDEEGEPDEQELVTRLRQKMAQYQAYKQAAAALNEARRVRQRIYLRSLDEASGIDSGFVHLEDVSIFDMVAAVRRMLKEAEAEESARVALPPVSIAECVQEALSRLQAIEPRPATFFELVAMPATRMLIIYMFLAVLELIRRQCVRVYQDGPGADILVELTDDFQARVADATPGD